MPAKNFILSKRDFIQIILSHDSEGAHEIRKGSNDLKIT